MPWHLRRSFMGYRKFSVFFPVPAAPGYPGQTGRKDPGPGFPAPSRGAPWARLRGAGGSRPFAAGESATACLSLHRIKKILVNPIATFEDLNNVPEYARLHTYGFFGALPQQQKSYELFQTVYPNVAWYVNAPDLSLIDIKDIIYGIINSII